MSLSKEQTAEKVEQIRAMLAGLSFSDAISIQHLFQREMSDLAIALFTTNQAAQDESQMRVKPFHDAPNTVLGERRE